MNIVKHIIEKRSKYWWIVAVYEDNTTQGIDGNRSKTVLKKMAKDYGIKISK